MSLPGVKVAENNGASHDLICTPTCWRCKKPYRNQGLGAQLKLEQRREALARGIRLHGMDVRSAGNQERLSEYPQAGRHCAPLSREFLWCILFSICRADCRRTGLLAEWQLDSPRVSATLEGRSCSTQIRSRSASRSRLHLRVEGIRERPGARSRRSVGESPEVSTGICPRTGRTRLSSGMQKEMESSNWAIFSQSELGHLTIRGTPKNL